uniref:Coiled-coil domain-containing protein 47 n=1 Tax=Vannella robusta TaxID=1487602 RepID=A0A7S4ID72_9EUKA|mmetsp:Transcript_24098/g.30656  ORF Transcript_24098/g.30656 Transcript_24098/m.30656 type:complete len:430 (+) Transcript_24098:1-1290(+)
MNSRTFLLVLLIAVFAFASLSLGNTDSFEDFEAVFSENPDSKELNKDSAPVEDSDATLKIDSVVGADTFYDEEEFEGFEDMEVPVPAPVPIVNNENAKPIPTEEIKDKTPKKAPKFDWKEKDWSIEIGYASIIVLYLLNLVYGKYRNSQIVQAWMKQSIDLYKANFYYVGHGEKLIRQESSSTYTLTTVGRVHCSGSFTEIQLRKRHDLLSLVLNLLSPSKDTMTLTVPLNSNEMAPFVFALVSAGAKKNFVKEHKDLENTTQKSVSGLPTMSCFTDAPELVSTILCSDILSVIQEYSHLIEWIHVTDIHPEYIHSNILQLCLKLPTDVSQLEQLTKLAFFLIDFLPSVQLSKNSLVHIQKIRKQLQRKLEKESNLARQEVLQAKKEEAKKELLQKMTPEELEKYKDRQEKKRMRKLSKKQSKKIVSMG